MKKAFPKSSAALFLAAVSVAFGLTVLSCDNTTGSSSGKSYTGVLGELSGVVFDEITGLPIQGVLVSAGERKAYTDAAGAFTVDNIIPGTYTVSYTKAGYRIATQTGIQIDANKYKADDPYLEVDAYNKYYTLFTTWLASRTDVQKELAKEDQPDFYGSTGNWTYNGGGEFVSEQGDIVVTYNDASGDFDFTFDPTGVKKLDYTYRYGYTLKVVALKPLNAGFDGEIKIVLAHTGSVAKPAPIPIPAGISVWFTDTSITTPYNPSPVGETGADDTIAVAGIYKAETDKNGKFSVVGLPVNTEFTVTVNNFAHTEGAETFYFNGTILYKLDETAFTPTSLGNVLTLADGTFTLPPIVLYAEKEVIFVTDYKAGSLATPLPVRGEEAKIEVTFSEPLDITTFSALLHDNSTFNGYGDVRLTAESWSEDSKTVTLVAAEKPGANYTTTTLPFNVFTNLADVEPTGTLTLKAKKKDGTEAFIAASVPVYTEEKIKLLSVDIVEPTDPALERPARALYTVKLNGAVKLTFSKPVAANDTKTKFTFGGTNAAAYGEPDYKIAENVVYVYVDRKIPLSLFTAGLYVDWQVVAAAHPDDIKNGDTTSQYFTTDGLQQLVVSQTNLYDPNPVFSIDAATGLIKAHSYFPLNGNIEITFTRDIEGGKAEAELFIVTATGDYNYPAQTNKVAIADPVVEGKKVTIDPAANLQPVTEYILSLTVFDAAGEAIYTTEGITTTGLILSANTDYIGFTTAEQVLNLTHTNLYDELYINDTSNLSVTPYFPIDGTIELTFDREIPHLLGIAVDETRVKLFKDANLTQAVILKSVEIDGATIKATPLNPLDPNAPYYITVNLRHGSQPLFFIHDDWETWQGKTVAVRGTGSSGDSIVFQTENVFARVDSNFVSGTPLTLAGDLDIIGIFNKEIASVDKAELYYVNGSGDRIKVSPSGVTSEYAGKVVTVKYANTLAAGETYELVLYVTTNEGGVPEQLVYDSNWKDNNTVISPYAQYNDSVSFQATAVENHPASNAPVLRSQKPLKSLGTIAAAPATPRTTGTDTVDLTITGLPLGFEDNFTVWRKWQNSITWTELIGGFDELPSAPTAYAVRTTIPAVDTPTAPVEYLIQGIDGEGYVTQSPVSVQVKAPNRALDTAQIDDTPGPSIGELQYSELDANPNPNSFYADKNIVLVFNKAIAETGGVTGSFYYNDGGILRLSDATFTVAGKTVIIDPAHLLAENEQYDISLTVKSADGDSVEYNVAKAASTTDTGEVFGYNLYFDADGLSPTAGAADIPIDLTVTVKNADLTNLTTAGSVPNNVGTVALSWTAPANGADLADSAYTIENRYEEGTWSTISDKLRVPDSTVAFRLDANDGNNLVAAAGVTEKRTILYRVTTINRQGFTVQGQTSVIKRSPTLVGAAVLPFRSSSGIDLMSNDLPLDEDIVFEFNKDVEVLSIALYYKNNTNYLYPLVLTTDYTVTTTGKFVTIKPVDVLGYGAEFELTLDVKAADGDGRIVADSSRRYTEALPDVTAYGSNISITAATPGTVPAFENFKKTIRSLPVDTNPTATTPYPSATYSLIFRWSVPVLSSVQTQDYSLYEVSTVSGLNTTAVATYQASSNTAISNWDETVNTGYLLNETHTALRPLVYVLESTDARGFLLRGTKKITFTND
jgi:hypothetical protein